MLVCCYSARGVFLAHAVKLLAAVLLRETIHLASYSVSYIYIFSSIPVIVHLGRGVGYLGPLASQYPHSIIAYAVANCSPHISHFGLLRACSIDRISEQEYYKNKLKKSLVLVFITLAISRNLLHIKYFNICRVWIKVFEQEICNKTMMHLCLGIRSVEQAPRWSGNFFTFCLKLSIYLYYSQPPFALGKQRAV